MPADIPFRAAMAVQLQTDPGVAEPSVVALDITAGLTSADGIVLGDRESGDGETGIVIPNLEPLIREAAPLGRSRSDATYFRTQVQNLAITYQRKGNGVARSASPANGEARPLEGLDALHQIAGLEQVTPVDLTQQYRPAKAAGMRLGTIALWVGRHKYVFVDCVVDQRSTVYTGGAGILVTDTIRVGFLDVANSDWGTIDGAYNLDYGSQASLAAPLVQNVGFSWQVSTEPFARLGGFRELTVTLNNNYAEVEDSNRPNGIRLVPGTAEMQATGVVYRTYDETDTDTQARSSRFEIDQATYGETAAAPAPNNGDLADVAFQVGTSAAVTGDTYNSVNIKAPRTRWQTGKADAINVTVHGDEVTLDFRTDAAAGEQGEYLETYG